MFNISDYMNLPADCELGSIIFKKQIYEKAKLSRSDKELFTKNIEKILWNYSLKTQNINIKPFKDDIREYEEIEFISVVLKKPYKTKRIADIIMRTIPYPTVLTFEFENKIRIFTGHQRINLVDTSKNTIDEHIFTDWINLDNLDEIDQKFFRNLNIKNVNYTNFYTFYNDIINIIIQYNTSKIAGNYTSLPIDEMKLVYDDINSINSQIGFLKSQIKKETQFNREVELNIEIKKLKDRSEELKGRLN